jgi:hypothetical protein
MAWCLNNRAQGQFCFLIVNWWIYFLLKILPSLSLTHGAEPFLRSCQLCSHSRTSQRFMEPEGSLQRSKEPSTSPFPEPDRSNPSHPIPWKYYHIHKIESADCMLRQMNPNHILTRICKFRLINSRIVCYIWAVICVLVWMPEHKESRTDVYDVTKLCSGYRTIMGGVPGPQQINARACFLLTCWPSDRFTCSTCPACVQFNNSK